jgi:CDP-glycerol glycerophosphotransferase (TagB/SpsB family)
MFYSSDDAYPVFEKMIKKKMNAHYLDGKEFIYKKFCEHEKYCLKVLPIINKRIIIDGDFLENYLDIILRLKAVIVGHHIPSFTNIFYNLDYIAYINLGHGIKYFKHFLYNNYTSYKQYNKLVLPSSKKIIDIAKKYGWSDNNIIKLCLPKWDKYNINKNQIINNKEKYNESIFIMFTWRNLKKKKYKISPSYISNIINLLNNDILLSSLKKKNIILYFAFHPNFEKYKKKIKLNKLVKYIDYLNISNCLMKSNLLISDFSSVIFDMIYQNKPYVLFIPDAYDKNIKNLYEEGYYDIINGLKNGTIYFENVFFSINETVKKVIYYIENNFELERKLINFYDSFQLKCNNSLNAFINYLISY